MFISIYSLHIVAFIKSCMVYFKWLIDKFNFYKNLLFVYSVFGKYFVVLYKWTLFNVNLI